MPSKLPKVQAYVTKDLKAKIARIAAADRRSESFVVHDLLEQGVIHQLNVLAASRASRSTKKGATGAAAKPARSAQTGHAALGVIHHRKLAPAKK